MPSPLDFPFPVFHYFFTIIGLLFGISVVSKLDYFIIKDGQITLWTRLILSVFIWFGQVISLPEFHLLAGGVVPFSYWILVGGWTVAALLYLVLAFQYKNLSPKSKKDLF